MQHPMRNALAAALTAAVALGLSAPAASAAGQHHATEQAHHGVAQHGHVHATKFSKHSAHARQALREIANLDARLARVTRDSRLAALSDDQKAAVQANVAADRAALSALEDAVLAAGSTADLRAVRASLREVRPEVYTVALLDLRRIARLQATVDQNAADLAAITDRDVTAGAAANDQAASALADAVAKALAVTAESSNADLRAIGTDVRTAHQALETVEEVLAGTADGTDPAGSTDPTDPTDPTSPDA